MSKLSRKSFLKQSAASMLVLGTGGLFLQCSKEELISIKPVQKDLINATVSTVKGDNLFEMTRSAVDAIGGMSSVVAKNDVVFVKPNFVTFPWAKSNRCFKKGECTKPEILIAVAEECFKAGAKEVIIGDGSQMKTFDWKYANTFDRKRNLVDEVERLKNEYGAKLTLSCLEVDNPCTLEIPSTIRPEGKLWISDVYKKADKIISIPVAKTHRWSQLSLGAKNFFGVLSIAKYGADLGTHWDRGQTQLNKNAIDHSSAEAVAQTFLDVVTAYKPDLTIIDFSIGMEGNGPASDSGGETVDVKDRLGSWLLLASKDIMAADATAARIMSHNVKKIKQLNMGYEMGLGEINEENIQIVGESLSSLIMDWKPAKRGNTW